LPAGQEKVDRRRVVRVWRVYPEVTD